MHLNHCTFLARIATVPESRYTKDKDHVVNFTIAIPRQTKDHKADFLDATAWKKNADFIERYVHKGDLVVISGVFEMQYWKDQETGETRSKPLLNYAQIHFNQLSKENRNEYGGGEATFTDAYGTYDRDIDSGLPF